MQLFTAKLWNHNGRVHLLGIRVVWMCVHACGMQPNPAYHRSEMCTVRCSHRPCLHTELLTDDRGSEIGDRGLHRKVHCQNTGSLLALDGKHNVGARETKQMRPGGWPVCHQRRLSSSWWWLWVGTGSYFIITTISGSYTGRSDSAQSAPNLGINYNQSTVGCLGSGGPALLLAIRLIPRRRRWLMPHRSSSRPGHLRVREAAAPAGRRYSNHAVSQGSEPIC